MHYRRIILILSGIILGFVGLWFVGLVWFSWKINSYPQYLETPTQAVVVLTGGRHRIAEGIGILNNHLADKLFISGVPQKVKFADIERQAGVKAYNPYKVELGYKATDTISNAAEIKDWVLKNKIESLRLITSNYHIPRALEELSVYRLPTVIVVHPVYSQKVAKNWWRFGGTFKLIAGEYNKFLYTWLHHRLQNFIGD